MTNKSKAAASQSIVNSGLSRAATSILVNNLSANTLKGAAGVNPSDLPEEVTLFCVVLDETGSMAKSYDAVLASFDEMVKALKDSKAADKIAMSVWAFNSAEGTRLIHSYLPLDLVPPLSGYNPDQMTNLYDAALDAFTSLVDYEDDLKNAGTRTQAVVVIFTDGMDNKSHSNAADVKTVADELLKKETYVLSLVGFGNDLDPHQVAAEMGLPNVLKVGDTAHDIRLAMGTVSKSVIRTSQTKITGKSQSGFFTTK